MIHLYFGEGKGKTTAAIGLSVRALGNNVPVVFVQFLKSRNAGEIASLEKLGASIFRGKGCGKFSFQMSEEEKSQAKKIHDENFRCSLELCRNLPEKKLLVLDEICAAWNSNLIEKKLLEDLLKQKDENLELVLTGRNPPEVFFENADYITEMKKIRHPYDSGTKARQGVEW